MKSKLRKLIVLIIVICLGFAAITQIANMQIAKRIPRDGEMVLIDGIDLHYRDVGAGPAIVLIHGLSGQMRNFAPDLVDRLAVDHRVVLIDRPGAGYSAPLASGSNTMAGQADVIAGLIGALDLDAPLIVGHSLGGAVALNLALNHEDSVGALALIAPVTQPSDTVSSAFSAMSIKSDGLRRFVSLTFATPLGLLIFDRSAKSVFAPETMPENFGVSGGSLLAIRPTSYFSAGGDMIALRAALPEMAQRYPSLGMPVAILFGRSDQVLDPAKHGATRSRGPR
jgi:pimeloyl-ACP methyl ester carboxylesterase